MERRDFLRTGCTACLGLLAGAALLPAAGCSSSKAAFTEENGGIALPLTELARDGHVVLRPKSLTDPLFVAKQTDGTYTALLMKCPHKGGPITATADGLSCDWHHSTFDLTGHVTKGPARTDLKAYPTEVQGDRLRITLA